MRKTPFTPSGLLTVICSLLLLSGCTDHDDPVPDPAIEVTSIFPDAAGGGDTIRIYGKNMKVTGMKSRITASLNGETVAIISACPDSILAIVPEMAGSGNLTVQIGANTFEKPFTYNYVATVTTIAGSGNSGKDDGIGAAASFNFPMGITYDSSTENLYVADAYNRLIRKVNIASSSVSSIPITTYQFYSPYNIAINQLTKQLYLTDHNEHLMRVDPDGTNTIIYEGPMPLAAVALGPDHHLYISNRSYGTIFRLDTTGNNITQFASGLITPNNIIFDKAGLMWVAAFDIAKITPTGEVTFLTRDLQSAGAAIALDRRGNVYEVSQSDYKLRIIEKSTGRSIVIAGNGNAEDVDGPGLQASFNMSWGLTIDKHGALYLTTYDIETGKGNKIRKIVVR